MLHVISAEWPTSGARPNFRLQALAGTGIRHTEEAPVLEAANSAFVSVALLPRRAAPFVASNGRAGPADVYAKSQRGCMIHRAGHLFAKFLAVGDS